MELRKLADEVLLKNTVALSQRERVTTAALVKYLAEIDRRKLYVERGFSSMFNYCVTELKMSEGQALRRIKTARLLREIPQLQEKIEEGKITLTTASKMESLFKENKTSHEDKKEILKQIEGKSTREVEKIAMGLWGEDAVPPIEIVKMASQTQVQITITVSEETANYLKELKTQMMRKGVKDLGGVITELCEEKKKELNKNEVQPKKEQELRCNPAEPRNRHIPLSIKRQVFKRAQNKCEHFTVGTHEAALKFCGSKIGLEIDHIKPCAHGGTHELSNLRLLCRAHHARETFKIFGPQVATKMVKMTAMKSPGR